MSVGLGTAVGYLQLNISGFAAGVDSAIADMNRLNGSFDTASQGLQTIGGMFTKAGAALTAGFTAPVIGATSASVKFGTEFDKQMSNVKAVTGATAEEFEELREAAIKWGEKTVYTATQAGEALYYMGLAGWDADQSIAGLGDVLNLAAAGNLDLGRTSDIVTDALTAFGLTANDTAMFTNVLAAAMSNSNTDVDMMGESFKYAASVAGSLKYSVKDVAVALGIFANSGIKSSQAGTGLRQAFNALINPSDKAAQVMTEYGVSLFNADGSAKDFMTVMLELRRTFSFTEADIASMSDRIGELTEGMDEDADTTAVASQVLEEFGASIPANDMEKITALVQMFGVRALPGMLSVINASQDDFDGLVEKIYGADEAFVQFGNEIYTMDEALEKFGDKVYTDPSFQVLGASAGMAAVQMDNLAGDWTKFTSALGTSQILISDMAKGILRDFVQKLTELVTWFNSLDDSQREQIAKWALIIAAIGPVLMAIGGVISMIGKLMDTFAMLKGAFGFITGGLRNFVTAFNTAGTAGSTVVGVMGKLGAALSTISAPIVAVIAIIGALVAAFIQLWNTNEDFRNSIIEIWEGIKAKFDEAGERIAEIFGELGITIEDVKEVISIALDFIIARWNNLVELLAPVFIGVFSIISDVIGGFVDTFVALVEILAGIIKGFKDGDWSMLWQGMADLVSASFEAVIGIFDHFGEMIWGVIQTIAGFLGVDWTMSWEDAKQVVSDFADSVSSTVSGFVDAIVGFFTMIWDTVGPILTAIGEGVTTVLGMVAQLFVDRFTAIYTTVSTIFTSVWNTVYSVMTQIHECLVTVWNTIYEAVSQVVGIIYETVSSIFTTIFDTIWQVMQDIWECIVSIFTQIAEYHQSICETIWETISSVFGDILLTITEIFLGIQETVLSIWDAIVSFLKGDIDDAKEHIIDAWNMIYNTTQEVINNVCNIIRTVWGAIQTIIVNTVKYILNIIKTVFNTIRSVISTVVNAIFSIIKTQFNAIQNTIQVVTHAIYTVISTVWNTIKSTISTVVNAIKSTIVDTFNNIKSTVTTTVNNLYSSISGTFNSLKTSMSNAMTDAKSNVISAMTKAKEGMVGVFDGILTTFKGIGKNVIQGIIDGIGSMVESLYESIKNALSGLVKKAKDALGIKSPSKVFREQIGKWLPPGIAEGFMSAMPEAVSDIEDSINKGVNGIEVDNIDAGNVDLGEHVTDFIEAYKGVFEDLVIWFESMEERLATSIDGLTESLRYLMYVRQTMGKDNEFKSFILGSTVNTRLRRTNDSMTTNSPTRTGGDTFIFQSPKAIDEVEAARLLKTTKRDLAEGF